MNCVDATRVITHDAQKSHTPASASAVGRTVARPSCSVLALITVLTV